MPFEYGRFYMTTLLHDATRELHGSEGYTPSSAFPASELLYADDTLIVDVNAQNAERFMTAIASAGLNYGLAFNWKKKFEVLPVRCVASIPTPDGSEVPQKSSIVYLGSLLHGDGNIGSELGRRLGAAQSDFKSLCKVWGRSTVSRQRKLTIFSACVISELLYCLHTAWLNTAERRRLDAFQARCLRKICGVQHYFISRVTNETVRDMAGCKPLSSILLERQLVLFADIARRPFADPLRKCVFEGSSMLLRSQSGRRKQGRPRNTWATSVCQEAVAAAGGRAQLNILPASSSAADWKALARKHCSRVINHLE